MRIRLPWAGAVVGLGWQARPACKPAACLWCGRLRPQERVPTCPLPLPNSGAADEEAVRNSQAYMLFYSQKQLLEAR